MNNEMRRALEWRRSVSGVRLRGSVCPLGESAPPVHPALPQPSSRCRCHHRCPTDIRCARWLTARARARRTSITADDGGAAAQNRQRRQTAPAAASAEQSQWCHCHCHCHCARSLVRCLSLPSCLQCHGGVRVWRCAVAGGSTTIGPVGLRSPLCLASLVATVSQIGRQEKHSERER